MRDIEKELEGYENYYKTLMRMAYDLRIGLGEEALIATIKNGNDDRLKLLCYIELRHNAFIPKKILNDVKNFPSMEDTDND